MSKAEKIGIIAFTDQGLALAKVVQAEYYRSKIYTTRETVYSKDVIQISSAEKLMEQKFSSCTAWIFISALGICVRSIAPYIQDKLTDPAVVSMDDQGCFVQSVLSGHTGGANEISIKISRIFQAQAVISTSTDLQQLWSLDLLAKKYHWETDNKETMNQAVSLFVNRKPTALILQVRDQGTAFLEKTRPGFVDIYASLEELDQQQYALIIYIGYELISSKLPVLSFYPKCLALGTGCSKHIEPELFRQKLLDELKEKGIAWQSIASLSSVDIKAGEPAYQQVAAKHNWDFITYTPAALDEVQLANPSGAVYAKIGIHGVSESAAALTAKSNSWLIEKTKAVVSSGKMFTYALSVLAGYRKQGQIAIVGAGPGSPDYITVKGKELLEQADCILYAGSLVPEELTSFAKPGALVRNSASMTLEEQMSIMDQIYQQGKLVVRLHSGDPAIYGAIQEQMTLFDERGYDYFIVPGISSFQAAAAYLKSEFTIPEVAQTIILTRGEGNTPMPEREKLEEMARLRATMCIFLSAGIVRKVQEQLLQHYPPETPLAVLYRVSWKDEKVWTGTLDQLSRIIRENKLSRTVLIIVGDAIGARKNRSWLYGGNWNHIFRKKGNEISS